MPRYHLNDTIVAISTPIGEGGIGIVRLSGPEALSIADKMFQGRQGEKPSTLPTYIIRYGRIVDNGRVIDEVILTVMRAPKTYTREDVVEINCHGGIVPLKQVLELALKFGARLAEPGEFTKRAFLNGRIDLAQAEAVIDIIRAKTEASLKIAMHQLEGDLSQEVERLRQEVIALLSFLEAALDFPEEDLEFLPPKELFNRAARVLEDLQKLLATAEKGKILREGLTTVIAGKPNVGKSSLMNALLKEERVIVTPIPGTTRDTIEEVANIDGIPLKFVDTAGIRRPQNLVEKIGVDRSRLYLGRADLILLVLDSSAPLSKEDFQLMGEVKERKAIVVLNKIDLEERVNLKEIRRRLPDKPLVRISATKRIGLSDLEETIKEMVWKGKVTISEEILVTNVRHKNALLRAKESMERVLAAIPSGLSEEFISIDLRGALDSLGEIVGETVTEDILDRIFSQFCIGK